MMTLPTLTSRTSLIVTVTAAVVLGFAGWAIAEGGVPLVSSPASDVATDSSTSTLPSSPGSGTDNVAIATNDRDGSTVFAISLKIVKVDSDPVDPTNAAVAVANCSDCQTVAIALEGVLVSGNPTFFDPTNVALAINGGCSNCETLAKAYQAVVQNDTKVRITGTGRQEIASIRKDLESLRTSGLDIVTIKRRVDEAAARLLDVLRNEVVPIGRPATTTTTSPGASTTTTVAETTTSTTAPTTTTTSAPTSTTTAVP